MDVGNNDEKEKSWRSEIIFIEIYREMEEGKGNGEGERGWYY